MMEWLWSIWLSFSVVNMLVMLALIISGNWAVQWYGWFVAIITGPIGTILLALTMMRNT